MSDAEEPPLYDEVIVCVDCGGAAHLISYLDDEAPVQPGDVLVYRCADCLDRWDVVVPGGEDDA